MYYTLFTCHVSIECVSFQPQSRSSLPDPRPLQIFQPRLDGRGSRSTRHTLGNPQVGQLKEGTPAVVRLPQQKNMAAVGNSEKTSTKC